MSVLRLLFPSTNDKKIGHLSMINAQLKETSLRRRIRLRKLMCQTAKSTRGRMVNLQPRKRPTRSPRSHRKPHSPPNHLSAGGLNSIVNVTFVISKRMNFFLYIFIIIIFSFSFFFLLRVTPLGFRRIKEVLEENIIVFV